MDDYTYSVLTNEDAIKINQTSTNNREVKFERNKYTVWAASSPDGKEHYLAMFNLEDQPMDLSVSLKEIGLENIKTIKDIWSGEEKAFTSGEIQYSIEPHSVKYMILK